MKPVHIASNSGLWMMRGSTFRGAEMREGKEARGSLELDKGRGGSRAQGWPVL